MKRLFVLALLLTCTACSPADAPADEVVEAAEKMIDPAAQPTPLAKGKWAPRDTCTEVEGSAEFRQRLAAAVHARDDDALVALAAEDIRLDFGDGGGKEELRARLDDLASNLWEELRTLMSLGCSANAQGGITIPWYFDQDLGNADPFQTMIVTGENIPVHERALATSPRVASISWDLVTLAGPLTDGRYQRVELADGTIGYIARSQLRSLV